MIVGKNSDRSTIYFAPFLSAWSTSAMTTHRVPFLVLSACAVILVVGCSDRPTFRCPDKNPIVNPWTHLRFANSAADFQFAIVADRTGAERPGVFRRAMDALNLLRPEFVLSIGDLIEGRTEDVGEIVRQWTELDSMVWKLEMPFFYLAGNHDHESQVLRNAWGIRYGRSYYHFSYGDVLFLCMNTEDTAATSVTDQQLAYFEAALARNSSPRWTFVLMHKPLWHYLPKAWERMKAALGERRFTVLAGHHHTYQHQTVDGRDYIQLAVTGGVNELTGPAHGKFDHIVWVSMTDNGPRIANLALDGIFDKVVRTPDSASTPRTQTTGAYAQ
jgi:hypothetical protein